MPIIGAAQRDSFVIGAGEPGNAGRVPRPGSAGLAVHRHAAARQARDVLGDERLAGDTGEGAAGQRDGRADRMVREAVQVEDVATATTRETREVDVAEGRPV